MRRIFAAALAALWLAAPRAGAVGADKYPERQIRIIVPYPPGGSVDVLGRLLAQRMQENWGQTVIVENRPGAGTMIGTAAAAKADPDGYTLIIAVSGHTTNPALYASMQYDGIKDFAPIALLARTPVVLYAHPSLPAKDAKELVALGKAKTHTLNFGSAGVGSMTHLTGELIKVQAGIEMLHIVYRGGTPAMNDLLAGHLPLQFATGRAGAAAVQGRAVARARHLVGGTLRLGAGNPDVQGTGHRCGHHRVVRPACAGRDAAADHREAQCRDEAHHGAARHGRPPVGDRADAFDAGGARRVHQRRRRSAGPR